MAWQILATSMLKDMKLIYESPNNSSITDIKLIVSNYSGDIITLYAVWAPWWKLSTWELQRDVTSVAVTEEEKRQRAICIKKLEQYERIIEDWLLIWDEDQIRWESTNGTSNIVIFGDINLAWAEIEVLKAKVLAWTATAWDKEKLMLLTWWAYQINTNNCNCP